MCSRGRALGLLQVGAACIRGSSVDGGCPVQCKVDGGTAQVQPVACPGRGGSGAGS